MITSRLTENGWLQIVIQSDKAINDIQSFQIRVSKCVIEDMISCIEKTLNRIEWIKNNFRCDKEIQKLYDHADVINVRSFVAISYLSSNRVHLIFKNATMYISPEDLVALLSNLKDLIVKSWNI